MNYQDPPFAGCELSISQTLQRRQLVDRIYHNYQRIINDAFPGMFLAMSLEHGPSAPPTVTDLIPTYELLGRDPDIAHLKRAAIITHAQWLLSEAWKQIQLEGVTLLSTVVAPAFAAGRLELSPVEDLADALRSVTRNLCGHPLTDAALRSVCPDLPAPQKAYWTGAPLGLAVRPKGGVRAAHTTGDTAVTLDDLEAVWVAWIPRTI
jgi:hypothetical protein